MYYSIFIHSPTEKHLGCFQVFDIMSKAAINICVHIFMWTLFSTSLDKYQHQWLLSYDKSMFSSLQKRSSKVAIQFFFPTSNVWEFLLLHILVSIWCSHQMTYNVEHLFIFWSAIYIPSSVSCLLGSLAHLRVCVCVYSFKSTFCISDNMSPLWVFCKYFSPSLWPVY